MSSSSAVPAAEVKPSKAPKGKETKPKETKPKELGQEQPKTDDAQKTKQKSLKEQKRLQKQAQRAAKKEQMATAGGGQSVGAEGQGIASQNPISPHHSRSGSNGGHPNRGAGPGSQPQSNIVLNLFSGIEPPRAIISKASVHPAILHLALQMQSCHLIGSTARCKAMMLAFMQVIRDYKTPANTTLSRSLAIHFSHQIEVLKSGRGLSVAMGNAIRWLKQETSELRIDIPDHEAKEHLISIIDVFIRDRLDVANKIIVDNASQHIRDSGDVILTYGSSRGVIDTLVYAHVRQQKKFRVIVADSPPLFGGKKTARALASAGIMTTYVLMTALPYVMKGVTTLMVGAHAVVSNGNLYSRVGTAMVAVMASARSIPVLVLCETIKFSDRVQLDAFAVNEFLPGTDAVSGSNSVFYDLTDQSLISKVITEAGALPASSVPVILREYKQVL